MDTNNGTLGGGEILRYWNQNSTDGPSYLDTELIRQFLMLPAVRILIIILLIVAGFLVVMHILNVRNPFRGKMITKELNHIENVRKHDEAILRANGLIKAFTNLIERSPFAMSDLNKDYWVYNLTRADVRIPGKARVYRPEEFHAIVTTIEIIVSVIAILLAVFVNVTLGLVILGVTLVLGNTLPMMVIRNTVKKKDLEIVEHFADFYLMIHYVLLASASTPLSGVMKSYDKTTNSEEMHKFVDSCIHYIDTYGEFEATGYITRQYREIPEVGKLMRLIKQANEGGDVRAELMGFRNELLAAKKYAIEKRMEKLVAKAKASFAILMPILVQAVISAMAIYFDDLGVAATFI